MIDMDTNEKQKKRERGQSLVELAMSLTFMVLLVSGVVDLGRAFFTYIALRDAAQEGAAYASIARTYRWTPMACDEIVARSRSTSNTQIIDLNQAGIDIDYFDLFDVNLETPYDCYSLSPDSSIGDNLHACFGSTVVVRAAIANFPLSTPFLGAILGSQVIPIQATIEDTILTPECN